MVFFLLNTRRWLAAAVLSAVTAGAAFGQPTAVASSAFDGYKPYANEPVSDWKAANDTVANIGGWREYARQAQHTEATPATTAGKAVEATAKPDTPPTTKAKP